MKKKKMNEETVSEENVREENVNVENVDEQNVNVDDVSAQNANLESVNEQNVSEEKVNEQKVNKNDVKKGKAKKILKRLSIIAAFVIVVVGLYAYACIIFTPKDETDFLGARYYNYLNFQSEEKNSLDMVMFGDSDAYSGYIPLELYRKYGAASYVRAGPNESLSVIEKNLKETLRLQKPSLVVLETNCLFNQNNALQGSYIQKFIPYIAPFACHARWKELTAKDFVTLPKPKLSLLKGHSYNTAVANYSRPDGYMEDLSAPPEKLQKSVLKNFDNIAELCKKNDISLLLICFPTPVSWNNARSNAVSALAEEYGLPFVDFNLPLEGYQLDFSRHFFDEGNHLNNEGATVATEWLINYLSEHYTLPDHRGDENYAIWNDCLDYYDNLKAGNA